MIFVTLGTQNNSFTRLVDEIIRLKKQKIIDEKIVIQAGYTKATSIRDVEVFSFCSRDEMDKYLSDARYVITHAGVGTIIECLKKEKKVIAVPRKASYGEHVNDHQFQIAKIFEIQKYLISIEDVNELEKAIEKIKDFIPKRYVSDNSKLIGIVDNFIEENLKDKKGKNGI